VVGGVADHVLTLQGFDDGPLEGVGSRTQDQGASEEAPEVKASGALDADLDDGLEAVVEVFEATPSAHGDGPHLGYVGLAALVVGVRRVERGEEVPVPANQGLLVHGGGEV